MNFRLPIFFIFLISFKTNAQVNDSLPIDYVKPLFDFDKTKSIFKLSNEQAINQYKHLRFTAVTGYREGATITDGAGNFDSFVDQGQSTTRGFMYNKSLQYILTMGLYSDNQILLDVKDVSKYRYDDSLGSKLDWMRKNSYCYEFLMPIGTINDISVINDQLEHLFHVKIGEEIRLVDVLVLYRISKKDKILPQNSTDSRYSKLKFHISIDAMSDAIARMGKYKVVNETGYDGNFGFDQTLRSWKNIPSLRKLLQKFDLDIKIEKRNLTLFVIKEQV